MSASDRRASQSAFDDLRDRLVGHRFPGGVFTIASHERWLGHEAMRSPELPDGQLHPVWIILGALRGMGLDTEELLALAGASSEDGVLFGETTLEQRSPLFAGVEYVVAGGIIGLTRRTGRRAGVMDLMEFELTATGPEGHVVGVSRQTFILLRGQA